MRPICVVAALLLMMLPSAAVQRTRGGVTIPPEFMQEYMEAVRKHDTKKIEAILARIPWQDPLAARLHDAVAKGAVARVTDLLKKGAKPNSQLANGWTPLISLGGSDEQALAIARLLISKGANVNYRQPDQGWTPLISAASTSPGGVPLVKLLVEKGAKLEASMNTGETALHMAARFGNADVASYLIAKGANLEARTRAVSPPTRDDLPEEWKVELRKMEAENAARIGDAFEPGYEEAGKTPLFEAVRSRNLQMVRLLVAAGADVGVTDANGWTLLHDAVRFHSDVQVLAYLLDQGIDPNRASRAGFRPLHLATNVGFSVPSLEAIELLIRRGADLTLKNQMGETPAEYMKRMSAKNLAELKKMPHDAAMAKHVAEYERIVEKAIGLLSPKRGMNRWERESFGQP